EIEKDHHDELGQCPEDIDEGDDEPVEGPDPEGARHRQCEAEEDTERHHGRREGEGYPEPPEEGGEVFRDHRSVEEGLAQPSHRSGIAGHGAGHRSRRRITSLPARRGGYGGGTLVSADGPGP